MRKVPGIVLERVYDDYDYGRGLVAGLLTTLFAVPCVFSLLVKDAPEKAVEPLPGEPGYAPAEHPIGPASGGEAPVVPLPAPTPERGAEGG